MKNVMEHLLFMLIITLFMLFMLMADRTIISHDTYFAIAQNRLYLYSAPKYESISMQVHLKIEIAYEKREK